MESDNYKFIIVKANTLDFDVRKQMSEIFSEGFSQWLRFFAKDKNKIAKAFAHMFVLEHFYVAITNKKVAAIATCTDGSVLSIKLNKKELRKHLGWFKGTMAHLFLKKEFEALAENPSPSKGFIDFVGTALEFRGKGAASKLIRYIMENTAFKEYVIGEVADTNIPAMKLYTKLGFKEYKRKAMSRTIAKKNGINYLVSLKYVKSDMEW
ncbi:GNAT family N-acetyltransferase [Shimazuella alba]|uniref:GNAT family N-acetyltransferase n=1 Tax=Shimazuella alba TaxID=2690964 RepID=A0A6I4W0K2_9BACL|nr:GNAT family N-acetyltransferase [Shimazuella alba]MXQ54214.1 GNAT family N-acetyltransferase [Shimazuella alba]